jgi:hypothetical protein
VIVKSVWNIFEGGEGKEEDLKEKITVEHEKEEKEASEKIELRART